MRNLTRRETIGLTERPAHTFRCDRLQGRGPEGFDHMIRRPPRPPSMMVGRLSGNRSETPRPCDGGLSRVPQNSAPADSERRPSPIGGMRTAPWWTLRVRAGWEPCFSHHQSDQSRKRGSPPVFPRIRHPEEHERVRYFGDAARKQSQQHLADALKNTAEEGTNTSSITYGSSANSPSPSTN